MKKNKYTHYLVAHEHWVWGVTDQGPESLCPYQQSVDNIRLFNLKPVYLHPYLLPGESIYYRTWGLLVIAGVWWDNGRYRYRAQSGGDYTARQLIGHCT